MTWKIDGTEIKTPGKDNVTESKNKVWSSNTGRNTSGKMQGTLVAVKRKVEITWPVLTPSELAVISGLCDSKSAWHTLTYYDSYSGSSKTINGYFGDSSGSLYGVNAHGDMIVKGFKVDFIER